MFYMGSAKIIGAKRTKKYDFYVIITEQKQRKQKMRKKGMEKSKVMSTNKNNDDVAVYHSFSSLFEYINYCRNQGIRLTLLYYCYLYFPL